MLDAAASEYAELNAQEKSLDDLVESELLAMMEVLNEEVAQQVNTFALDVVKPEKEIDGVALP